MNRVHRLSSQTIEMSIAFAEITSMEHVLRGLVLNSLRAESTTILITINAEEASLTVRDDGHGISPSDVFSRRIKR